jgi:type I restriction enzyme S subunit
VSLPMGWTQTTLGDLLLGIDAGKNMRCEERPPHSGELGVVKVSAVTWGHFDSGQAKTLPPDYRPPEEARIRAGDFLISRANTLNLVGSVVLVDAEPEGLFLSDKILRLVLDEDVKKWVFWFLRSKLGRNQIEDLATGNQLSMRNITQDALRRIRHPLPPLAEQRRIVAKLNVLTARLARARAELDRAQNLTNKIRLSILRAVFQFGAEGMPPRWSLKRFDQVADIQLGRQRSPKDHVGPHMRPYLRAGNITWKGWDLTNVKEMNFTPEEFKTFCLKDGDVLLNEGSGSAKEVGKPAVWRGQIANVCFQNTLLRVRPFTYDSDLLRYCLLYLALSGQFIANTKGVNIIHIGKAGLSRFMIPEPPESEQKFLLERLNVAFGHVEHLEAEVVRARALLDRLEAAIVAKAFKGELVPQDPSDEPASVLLDRIRTHRETVPKPKRDRTAAA